MEVKAKLSHVRVTPRKMGLLADEIRGKSINEAMRFLKTSPRKRAAGLFNLLLKSAAANAEQKGTIDVDTLFVKTVTVGQGRSYRKYQPRAKGAAYVIKKRTSHINVVLAEM